MANIKLGDNTLTNVNQIKVKNADDVTQTVTFTEGSGSTYTAGTGIDITNNVISTNIPVISFDSISSIITLTEEQKSIIENNKIGIFVTEIPNVFNGHKLDKNQNEDTKIRVVTRKQIDVVNNIVICSGEFPIDGYLVLSMIHEYGTDQVETDYIELQQYLEAGDGIYRQR